MQGNIKIKDSQGNVIAEGNASQFPLYVECDTFIGIKNLTIRYSYLDDENKSGWKDRSKIKGLVMFKA